MLLIDIVNEQDEIIGQEEIEEVHRRGLLHRSVHVLIMNSQGMLFCRQRKLDSLRYPGYWSTAVGAHLTSGQSYETEAQSALQATLGIACALALMGKVRVKDGIENEINALYIGRIDASLKLDINFKRVAGGRFFNADELAHLTASERVTPHLLQAIELYRQNRN